MITVEGLIISERSTGEHDKYVSALTVEYGTIEISVKGANKFTGKNQASTQLFAYSRLCLNERKDRFYLESSELIHDFYDLRLDIKKMSLACYMGEVAKKAVLTQNFSREKNIMRLILNSLYLLERDKRSCEFIKSVFELRFCAESGFAPQLLGCRECYDYSSENLYFLLDKGYILCEEHFAESGFEAGYFNIKISNGEFCALQHICLADFEKLFNFKLSPKAQSNISLITERYIVYKLSFPLKTLDYYHAIC